MKINELARRLDVTPRAIRFYEEKGLLHPVKDPGNGYRLYTEEDAWRLQSIAAFREVGLSIGSIAKLLSFADNGDGETLRHDLELQRAVLFSQWIEWKHMLAAMDGMIDRLEAHKPLQLDDVFQLAARIKQVKAARSSWQDRWDYDRLAEQFDRKQEKSESPVGFIASAKDYELALGYMVQWIDPQPREAGLDIGAGTGNLTGRLLEAGADMYAVEQSRRMLARCRAKLPQVQAKLGNFLALPFFEGQFHFVATSFAFHHLTEEQQQLALEEMNRVLKLQGRIAIAGLMFEHAEAYQAKLADLQSAGKQEELLLLGQQHPVDRSRLLQWFRSNGFITVQQQINEWVHMVYAVRKQ
ncbi:MAG: transcriptional regulator [Paenibacillus sp.]|nr:transcriptional regulator [Paenibacillus sp.]